MPNNRLRVRVRFRQARRQGGHWGTVPPPNGFCAPVTVSPNYEKRQCALCILTDAMYPHANSLSVCVPIFCCCCDVWRQYSATCEAFSTLTRVLAAYRRSMTHERKRNLVILAFLRSYTKNVKMEEVLRCFSRPKNSRKLQLF